MTDDLISTDGFELGFPTREEMLKHQCDLLCSELDVTRRDLRQAHKNLAGVICMWRNSSKELATLRLEHERLRWTLSDLHRRETEQETSRMTYAYGDHGRRER
jgi:regulator of replication initiation timing